MYEPGSYWCKIVRFGTGQADNPNKTPYFYVELQPTHIADSSGAWQPNVSDQKTVTIFSYLSDAAFPRTFEKLTKFLEFNGDFNEPAISEKVQLQGINAVCAHEVYDGKTREKWEFPGGGTINHATLPNDLVRRLNAKWNEEKRSKVGPRMPKAAPTPSAPPVAQDSDIPF